MSDESRHVTPDAPRDLKPFEKESKWFPFILRRVVYTEAELKATVQLAVRGFADYLATTASPSGTVQRKKLQSFATEYLVGSSKPMEK